MRFREVKEAERNELLKEEDRGRVLSYLELRPSAPIEVVDRESIDRLELSRPEAEELLQEIYEGKISAGYDRVRKKIFIFAGQDISSIEGVLLHENTHAVLDKLGGEQYLVRGISEAAMKGSLGGKFTMRLWSALCEEYDSTEVEEEFVAALTQARITKPGWHDKVINGLPEDLQKAYKSKIIDNVEKREIFQFHATTYSEDSGSVGEPGGGGRERPEGGDSDGRRGRSDIEAKRSHAEGMAMRFNTPIRIVTERSELTHSNPEIQEAMRKNKGWYDPRTGQVVVVLPNNADVEDVAQTVFHEVVAHKGLREMIGEENYDAFCDEMYEHLKDDLKEGVDIARDAAKWEELRLGHDVAMLKDIKKVSNSEARLNAITIPDAEHNPLTNGAALKHLEPSDEHVAKIQKKIETTKRGLNVLAARMLIASRPIHEVLSVIYVIA